MKTDNQIHCRKSRRNCVGQFVANDYDAIHSIDQDVDCFMFNVHIAPLSVVLKTFTALQYELQT